MPAGPLSRSRHWTLLELTNWLKTWSNKNIHITRENVPPFQRKAKRTENHIMHYFKYIQVWEHCQCHQYQKSQPPQLPGVRGPPCRGAAAQCPRGSSALASNADPPLPIHTRKLNPVVGFLYNFTVSKTVLNSDDNFHFSCPFSCLTKSYDFLIDASVKLAEGWRPLFFRHKLRGTQKYLQVCKGYRETLYHLTDAVCEPDILKENFKLLEHKHFLVL